MVRKYSLLIAVSIIIGIFSILPATAYTVKIAPVSDKYPGETFTINGTTDQPDNEKIRIDIIPAQCPFDQEQLAQFLMKKYKGLDQSEEYIPDECREMTGASGLALIHQGLGGVHKFSFEVNTSTLASGNYKIMAGFGDVVFFNVPERESGLTPPMTDTITSAPATRNQTKITQNAQTTVTAAPDLPKDAAAPQKTPVGISVGIVAVAVSVLLIHRIH
jgi:hypothetical protein